MTYDVYAMGNALVDREYTVSDALLESLGLEKGLATLIDEAQLQSVMAHLDQAAFLRKQEGGGSAANTVIGLQQFGGSGAYACRIADDVLGQFYVNDLTKAGVDIAATPQAGDTGQCLVLVSEDGERTMMTYLGVSAQLDNTDMDAGRIASSQFVYVEGYLAPLPDAVIAVNAAKAVARDAGVKVALTFSDPSMTKYCKDGLLEMLEGGVDVLFCNEEEACIFAGTHDLDEALVELQTHAPHVVVTQGAKGVRIVRDGQQYEFATTPVRPLDTTGAGDVFAGAYLYGLTQGESLEFCATLANAAAAKIVTKYGPRLEGYEQQDILAQVRQAEAGHVAAREVDVCTLDALGAGTQTVTVDGKEIFVVNVEGDVKAYENYCPHLGIELNYMPNEFLDADNQYIVCANHGALFDRRTGECISGPCAGDTLNAVPVRVDEQVIKITLES